MVKFTLTLLFIAALFIVPARLAMTYSGFVREGVFEGLQSCKADDECIWVSTGCCNCNQGGGEVLINKDKEKTYNLLVKPICLGEQVCSSENLCHAEEVFCDKTCKFGERTYTKPLLSR